MFQNQNNSKKQSMKEKNHNTTKKNTLDTI